MKNIIYIVLLSSITFLNACKNKADIISPVKAKISESVYAFGTIKSKNQHEVFSKSSGILEEIYIKEGDEINIGDPLFKLENDNSRRNTANARLLSANAAYINNTDKIWDAQNALNLASKKLANDSAFFFKQQSLWESNIGSKLELEQKRLAFENAKVAFVNAEVRLQDLKKQLKLVSDQSKNNLAIAQSLEEDYIIRSDINGVIYKINKELGELVTSISPIAVIGEREFLIEFNIDEIDITKIKKGQKVIIRMDSYKSEVYEGEVSTIYPMMNERTRTFRAEAIFIKKPAQLYPYLTLEANIVINSNPTALTIPRRYLLTDSTVLLENGKIQRVETGLMDYSTVEIKGGLTTNNKIALPQK
jgi:HlyD family secretion protein